MNPDYIGEEIYCEEIIEEDEVDKKKERKKNFREFLNGKKYTKNSSKRRKKK